MISIFRVCAGGHPISNEGLEKTSFTQMLQAPASVEPKDDHACPLLALAATAADMSPISAASSMPSHGETGLYSLALFHIWNCNLYKVQLVDLPAVQPIFADFARLSSHSHMEVWLIT